MNIFMSILWVFGGKTTVLYRDPEYLEHFRVAGIPL